MKKASTKAIKKELEDIEEKAMIIGERIDKISKMIPANRLFSGVDYIHFIAMRSILNDMEKSAEIFRNSLKKEVRKKSRARGN